MSGDELCYTVKTRFSSLLMSDSVVLISFMFSHPLYFLYFIFFSPYLIKVICFLSPLFITTVLVSLAFFTSTDQLVLVRKGPVSLVCASVLGRLRNEDDHFHQTDHVEAPEILSYEIFFGSTVMENEDHQIPLQVLEETSQKIVNLEASSESTHHEDYSSSKAEYLSGGHVELEEKTVLDPKLKDANCETEEKRLKNFMKILNEFEKMSTDVEQIKRKVVKPTKSVKNDDKVVEKQKAEAGSLFTNGSEAKVTNSEACTQMTISVEENEPRTDGNSSRIMAIAQKTSLDRSDEAQSPSSSRAMDCYNNNNNNNNNLRSYGSMRKEKEWKRTLACKLFEERHNVDGGEGMDSLWEGYELNSEKLQKQKHEKSVKKSKNKVIMKKKSEVEEFIEEEDDEMNGTGQLCCLQALKLSTGKMNLGMGRPNLVKISKAVKGFGWLSKHSKKVHNI